MYVCVCVCVCLSRQDILHLQRVLFLARDLSMHQSDAISFGGTRCRPPCLRTRTVNMAEAPEVDLASKQDGQVTLLAFSCLEGVFAG